MTVAYFDCFAGAGGDMIVAALLDAGCDLAAVKAELAKLAARGFELRAEKVNRGGMIGTRFCVELTEPDPPHRSLGDIVSLIDAAGLAPRAADRAKRIFTRLAHAEAKVHNTDVEKVHFHEVGALDSIADVVGACAALEILGVDRILCSPIPVGSGIIQGDHGTMPVPAPATAELLCGAPIAAADLPYEATTPTAAAVLTTLAESYGPVPAMRVAAVGYGAGTRSEGPVPNLLRVFLGREDPHGQTDTVVELSANLDDCTGELIGAAMAALLSGGALDAWVTPITMKKSRPGWMLSAICPPQDVDAVERILLAETTTFGVRRMARARTKLLREHQTVETPYGPIRMKVGRLGDEVVTVSPEFDDCVEAARSHHVAVREALAAANDAYRRGDSAR